MCCQKNAGSKQGGVVTVASRVDGYYEHKRLDQSSVASPALSSLEERADQEVGESGNVANVGKELDFKGRALHCSS